MTELGHAEMSAFFVDRVFALKKRNLDDVL